MKLLMIAVILLGVVAAVSATMLMASIRAEVLASTESGRPQASEVEILVAARDLKEGSIVDASAVASRTVLQTEVPEGAARSTVQVVGQYLLLPMVEGEVFLRRSVAGGGGGYSLAPMLPEGSRAMSITVTADAGVAGLIYPGCLVDVFASFRAISEPGTPVGESVSIPLLQCIHVLDVGGQSITGRGSESDEQRTITPPQKRNLVTLRVNPEEAKALQLAMTYGTVSLALRNPLDLTRASQAGVWLSELNSALRRAIPRFDGSDAPEIAMSAPQIRDDPKGGPSATAAAESTLVSGVNEGGLGSADTAAAEPPLWTTVVLRGAAAETKTFPMPEFETTPSPPSDEEP